MKTTRTRGFPNIASRFGLAGAALLLASTGQAGLQIPYVPNANTLHLWHLDDPSGQLYATDAVTTASITLTNYGQPNPGTGPYTNAFFGTNSFPGQGTCLYCPGTVMGSGQLGKEHVLYGGQFSSVAPFVNPITGAFTFEALLRFNVSPLNGAIDAEIVSGDSTASVRGWQWRIYNGGATGGVMEWNLLGGSSGVDFKAALPNSGPDAALANTWYHVAVTFTGTSPTNSDTANVLSFYWTLLDANRTYADVLLVTNMAYALSGPSGAMPYLGVGGSARNLTTGNNEGIPGSIDEVRISQVCLYSNQMAFITGGSLNPPSITGQPPTNTLVGYGQPLTVNALATGTPPLSFQWYQAGAAVSGQTNLSLSIASPTFATGGAYQLIVTNAYGSATSTVASVTIGAAPSEFYDTGLDTNGLVSPGDVPDPHWSLLVSSDPAALGPAALIFETNCPIQFACGNGSISPDTGISQWIGAEGNVAGVSPNSPAGAYIYRTVFLLDSAVPSTLSLSGTLWLVSGSVTNILINGRSTGITVSPGGSLYNSPFSIATNLFVPGLNTMDFAVSMTGSAVSALRVQMTAVAQALPAGVPVITNQPVSQVVRDATITPGSEATFSVVALGRPPLSYQWWADGAPVLGASYRTLQFTNPIAGGQGTNFTVVVTSPYGAVTSQVATLTIVESNQPPVAATFNYVGFQGANITLPLSTILQTCTDPDGDAINILYWDTQSTNAVQYGTNNINEVSAALVFSSVQGYLGDDQFTYTIADALGASAVGTVNILTLPSPTPASQTVPPGLTASFSISMASPPTGYSFQWQLNGANIPGATTGQLTITNAQLANAGSYTIAVTDPHGVVWPSPAATLTVEAFAPHPVPIANIVDSSEQPAYPATNAVDGILTDFWVSYGTSAAGVPTAASPEWLFVMFPRQVALSEFLIYPRSGYGPNAIQVLVNSILLPGTPPNGTETIGIPTNGTVIYTGSMANSATPLDVALSAPVYATNIQLFITSSYSASNVQVSEMIFNERALPGTFGDWELHYFTNSAQINNPAISGIGADPDGDGVPNLLEFAVGGNPLVPDKTNAQVTAISLPLNEIAVQFQERTQLSDVTRSFVASPDLVHWTNAVPLSVTPVQTVGAVTIYQAVFPMQPTTPQYFRIEYTAANWQRQ